MQVCTATTWRHTYHIQYHRQVPQFKLAFCLWLCYGVRIDITRFVCNQNLIFSSCNNEGRASPIHRPERKMAQFEHAWELQQVWIQTQLNRPRQTRKKPVRCHILNTAAMRIMLQ